MINLHKLILRLVPMALLAGVLLQGSAAQTALSWTDPWILNDDGTSSSYQELPGHMASNGQQTVISASILLPGEALISRSTDAGVTFNKSQTIPFGAGLSHAQVIYNGGSNWTVFWRTDAGLGINVRSTDDGVSWSAPTNVSWTQVEENGAGTIMNALADSGDKAHISISTDGGHGWQHLTTIDLKNPTHLVHAGANHWVLYGSPSNHLEDGKVMVSTDNGATWSNGPVFPFVPEELESDHNGTIIAAAYLEPTQTYPIEKPTWAIIMKSTDYGATWENAQAVPMGENGYSIGLYYVEQVEDLHLMWTGGTRWDMILHIVHRQVVSVIGFLEYEAYSRAHLVQSCDGGETWTDPERIWDRVGSSYAHLTKFYSSGENLVVTWQRHDGLYEPSLYQYRDLFYQTAAKPDLPPGFCQPPPPPPGSTLANLEGVWSPVSAKVKTKKNGRVSSKLKASLLVINSGQTNAEKSVIRFFLSEDAVLDPEVDVELKSKKVKKLKPAKAKSTKVKVKLPADLAGYHLIAVLDSDGTIPERNEDDNIMVSPAVPGQKM